MESNGHRFDANLARSFELGKGWARRAQVSELPVQDFLEAAARVEPQAARGALAQAGIAPERIGELERRAAARAEFDAGSLPPMNLCPILARGLLRAQERAPLLALQPYLEALGEDGGFVAWMDGHYRKVAGPAPLKSTRELLELVVAHQRRSAELAHALQAGARPPDAHFAELERQRAQVQARWAATPAGASARALHASWELEPLGAAALAIEAVLTQDLYGGLGEGPLTPRKLSWMVALDAYPRGVTQALEAIELGRDLGLVRRASPLGEPSLHDYLFATEPLLLAASAACELDPIDACDLARARRWLCTH